MPREGRRRAREAGAEGGGGIWRRLRGLVPAGCADHEGSVQMVPVEGGEIPPFIARLNGEPVRDEDEEGDGRKPVEKELRNGRSFEWTESDDDDAWNLRR